MLEFRRAAASNNVSDLERLSRDTSDNFNIDAPGPQSGKTAAHVAAERANFKTIYWLFEKRANFFCKDNAGKTAIDYLQQKEFTFIGSNPMLKGDRKYYLCNAHYKIWFAHDREIFMPYLYQDDFRQYRERNPDGYISLVYSKTLLSNTAFSDLVEFAEKYQIALISFEEEFAKLIDEFGTEEDKQCYQLASNELNHYPNQRGGNLAVVADLIRWSSVLLRKGSYTDTDVEIGQHKWTDSISVDKSVALNLGSLVYPHMTTPWLNGDIIAASSLFPQLLHQEDFRITLSKTACFIIKKVQSSLLLSCQNKMKKRIMAQQFISITLSDCSLYLKDFFNSCGSDRCLTDNFSSDEINRIKEKGLELFSREEKASILERMASLMRKRVEQEYENPEMAHKHSDVFQNVKSDEHEKFLMNYMQAIQMSNIKEGVKQLSGTCVFSRPLWECIEKDDWKKYSIYSYEALQSGFRSTNTVKFDTDNAENERVIKTQKCADLSFTPFGMANVLQRSQALKEGRHKSLEVF
jgi:hypothetical protein